MRLSSSVIELHRTQIQRLAGSDLLGLGQIRLVSNRPAVGFDTSLIMRVATSKPRGPARFAVLNGSKPKPL